MKILSYSQFDNICFENKIKIKQNCKTLQKDTVSFGYSFEKVDPSIKLYRSIGEDEYRKLLDGRIIEGSKYVTSDPRGWNAHNWNSGYESQYNNETFFVSFKPNRFEFVSDARENDYDTKYRILYGYSLDDVENIRKGANAHGELIYSENFNGDKRKDLARKEYRILELGNIIKTAKNDNNLKAGAWDEILSYINELPNMFGYIKTCVNFENSIDVNGFGKILLALDDKNIELRPEFKKCLEAYASGMEPNIDFVLFLEKFVEKDDYVNLLKSMDLSCVRPQSIIPVLDANITPKRAVNGLYKNNPKKLNILAAYFEGKNEEGRYIEVYRKILEKLNTFTFDEKKAGMRFNRDEAVKRCAAQLALFGTKSDISLLKNFANNEYTKDEVVEAIDKIKKKN